MTPAVPKLKPTLFAGSPEFAALRINALSSGRAHLGGAAPERAEFCFVMAAARDSAVLRVGQARQAHPAFP